MNMESILSQLHLSTIEGVRKSANLGEHGPVFINPRTGEFLYIEEEAIVIIASWEKCITATTQHADSEIMSKQEFNEFLDNLKWRRGSLVPIDKSTTPFYLISCNEIFTPVFEKVIDGHAVFLLQPIINEDEFAQNDVDDEGGYF